MPGRNDQCPCGSGKKYKKCCLEKDRNETNLKIKDEQFELAPVKSDHLSAGISESIPTPVPKPAKPVDPHVAALNARWDEFEKEDDEGCREVFLKTLDEPELMDDEMAFEMLSRLYEIASKSGERDRFVELIDLLRERLPEVYNKNRKYYLQWRIAMAVAGYQAERLREFTREMAETAGEDVDNYLRVVNLLAYHGELAALSEASRIAWPLIKTSINILWGQSDFANWGVDCAIFERLESSQQLDGLDPQLVEQAKFYFEDLRLNHFEDYVAHLSGSATRVWSLEDFDFKTTRRSKREQRDGFDDDNDDQSSNDDPGMEALAHLLDEFAGYAHRQEGISYTKASLALKNIFRYLMQRHEGELEPRQSMFDAVMNPRKKPKPKPKPRQPDHPLCPDCVTFERYLGSMLNIIALRVYDVAATFELMPAWLRFLETRGLIDSSRRESTLADIGGLQSMLLKLWDSERDCVSLAENLRTWSENAARPCGFAIEPDSPSLPIQS